MTLWIGNGAVLKCSKGVIVWDWVKMLFTVCFNLDQSKILLFGNNFKLEILPSGVYLKGVILFFWKAYYHTVYF